MTNKFKVGDIVKIREDLVVDKRYNGGCRFDMSMDEYKGKITTIVGTNGRGDRYDLAIDNERWYWTDDMLELISVKTKYDLQIGDIVTLRNGDRLIRQKNGFTDMVDEFSNTLSCSSDLNDNLTYHGKYKDSNDIMKVERPTGYSTVFERQEEVKEMTIAEISKALGYEVKIVKEGE